MIELDDLIQATNGRLYGNTYARQFTELAFDSRRLEQLSPVSAGWVRSGPLFVAVKSDTGDGHDYIAEAVLKGATGVLCQRVPEKVPPGVTCLIVEDTRQALLDWAGLVLKKYGTQVIAVTGSSGKSMTKEAIAAVLSTRYAVFKNPGSFSGRYGLPIALGQLGHLHRIAVLELAADSLDEVRDLAALTRPTVGIVTTVNRAHVETLGSIEAIEREKGRLLEALPADGLAVLNRDDARVWRMRKRTHAQVVSFGLDESADYGAHNVQCTEQGLRFELVARREHGGRDNRAPTASCLPPDLEGDRHSSPILTGRAEAAPVHCSLRLMGRHHIYAGLAAIAVGMAYEVPLAQILTALAELDPLPGRLRPLSGLNGATLLDDSYDAGLADTLAALDALADHYERRNRIAVLGGIRRSGTSDQVQACVGERAVQVASELVLKGERAQAIRSSVTLAETDIDRSFVTYTNEEAARYLAQRLTANDVVLIKGAREERMEQITHRLLDHPDAAPSLLVRQEPAFRHVQLALPERPTWLQVDLQAIADNLDRVRRIVGPQVNVMAVLKADGYGHGAIRIARTALNNGARMLGVACLSEGVILRQAEIDSPILVLGYTPAWQAREAVLNDITTTVFDLDTVHTLSRVAGQVGRTARVHVKVDTGMGRLGLLPDQVLRMLQQAIRLPNLEIEGIFTHLSVADEADKTYTYQQLARFTALLDQIRQAGISIPLIHAANSAALLTLPEARFDMVRLGIALYGLAPSRDTPLPDGFSPALTFKTRVAQVKRLPPGSYVSYGNTYRTAGHETIAVIPVGYADGFRRAPAHWGHVLVNGQRAPIVGRVCMDQTMIDVTRIPGVRQGDEVVLIGRQGQEQITVEQVAEWLGTINYEVISEILARVPRVS